MVITRTANAGVLVETQGVRLLVDGVCETLPPYLGTPGEIRQELEANFPDAVAFTHMHSDHFSGSYANAYTEKTLRSVIGPESFPKAGGSIQIGPLRLTAVPSRHIGKVGDLPHVSYSIEGEKRVWIMGDASPMQWRGTQLPKPDVLIAPYAYAITAAAWELTKSLQAKAIILVHLPDRENDPYDLWQQLESTVGNRENLYIPMLGERIEL